MLGIISSLKIAIVGLALNLNVASVPDVDSVKRVEYSVPGMKFKASFPFNPDVMENQTRNESGAKVYKRIMTAEKENLSVFVAWFVDLDKTQLSVGHEKEILDATVNQFIQNIQDVIKINPTDGHRDFMIQGRQAREIQGTINGQGNMRLRVIVMNYGILVLQGVRDNGLLESHQLDKFFSEFEIISEQ